MARGLDRERKLRIALGDAGWVGVRASKGIVDLVLVKPSKFDDAGCVVRFVQVKSTAQSPYERFGPKERRELLKLAEEAGATAWLIWWPVRKGWRWIGSDQWPGQNR